MSDELTITVDAKYIYDKLTSIESTQKALADHVSEQNGRISKGEKRTAKLEKIHYKQAGVIAGVVGVVQFALNYMN